MKSYKYLVVIAVVSLFISIVSAIIADRLSSSLYDPDFNKSIWLTLIVTVPAGVVFLGSILAILARFIVDIYLSNK